MLKLKTMGIYERDYMKSPPPKKSFSPSDWWFLTIVIVIVLAFLVRRFG